MGQRSCYHSGIDMEPPASTPSSLSAQLVDLLVVVLSAVVISGINIIVSGHILGSILSLRPEGEYYIRIPLPPVLDMRIRGSSVVAGFSAFAISLLAVAAFWIDAAKSMFIAHMQATEKPLTACELLATLVSVLGCVLIATLVKGFQQLKGATAKIELDEAQVDKLIGRIK
jgi:hypothetical protein